ncbi:glycine--tRNA ligase subunit beta [Ramlibacter rhizophilus]|uniref:Glycine--tRNA ligase beta subunit n=1 Tax=Ramlibacter rhizophilus TaxID=1781167 RepID=A0A4Z0BN33_9BURK|nr:glycine--tRNA ligase subunit beta [Ramlibacter rhizophilus]TFY99474.1 glycine--tRNA ligase subunit beta [Ramlibacter rhizophilus]
MKTHDNLLVELLVEELPPKALRKLGHAFAEGLAEQLRAQGLASEATVVTAYASPRRLAAHLTAIAPRAPERTLAQKLMPVSVGLDAQGRPSPALLKKLQSLGLAESAAGELRRAADGKTEALFHDSRLRGATLAEGLQKALSEALAGLPIPKVMTYQLADGWTDVKFVRPAHGLVALYGAEVVPVRALGLAAGDTTQGHRFEAASDVVRISHADAYADTLAREGAVIASFEARRAEIVRQLAAAAERVGGGVRPIEDEALLDEVTALVERPNVLLCEFEPQFLQVPQECLILTMKANQKYFPLVDGEGRLTHRFLVVSNIRPEDPSAVVGGNERVVRPRLADAKFFFDQDRKKPLSTRVDGLARVVYHNKLGTQGERTQRVRQLAQAIGAQLGNDHLAWQADQAASLAKADLLTDMVGEFPELQGTMGRYYALADGLDAEIADAIEDHYKPRFAGDSLPRGQAGLVLALADKLETLAGLFGIGQLPSGDKDPFALRRHALGVVRMLMERDPPLSPTALVAEAVGLFPQAAPDTATLLSEFIYERLAGLLREQGYSAQEVEAVLTLKPQRLGEVARRLAAVRAFASLPEAPALAAANKRIANILRKSQEPVSAQVDADLLQEPAERALHAATRERAAAAGAQFEQGDYTGSLQTLAALREPVDAFFDHVMVNAEDPALRRNRHGLLAVLHQSMNRVADLSRLAA